MSTHHLGEAEQLCDRIAIIDEGEIRVIGSPEELKSTLDKPNSTLDDVFLDYTGKKFKEEAAQKHHYSERRRMMREGKRGVTRGGRIGG